MSKRTHLVCGLVAACAVLAPPATPGSVVRAPGGRTIQLVAKREGLPFRDRRAVPEPVGDACVYDNFQAPDIFVASQKDTDAPFWIEVADDFMFPGPATNKCILDSIETGFAFFNCGDVDGDGDSDQADCAALGLDPVDCWTGVKITIFEDISAAAPAPGLPPGCCHEMKQPGGCPVQDPPRDHFDCLEGAIGLVCELKVPMDKVTVTENPAVGAAAWDVDITDLKQYDCHLHKEHKYWIAVSPEQVFTTCFQTGIYMHTRVVDHTAMLWFPFFPTPPPITWVLIDIPLVTAPHDVAITITANKVGAVDCPADFDFDGFVGIVDFLDLLGRWGPCLACLQDLDGDGNVGIVDFLTLLSSWGPCP